MAMTCIQTERRHYVVDQQALWERLNLSQKFSVSSLNNFGYELSFIRHVRNESVAVLTMEEHVVTVNAQGEIDANPDISIRL